ncbi:Ectonucleoside triphosphate diphosphohydrolase 5 [Rhynchospora pubera]|uniref:Ectonucleoside triphosphate diphosphohydrolase 5 n=1 Tax=Rhynchospora pubera TaxID=906938 RepID=A0AAV8DTC5_9POAL|nr:Ectonucleoside triphosphate diphosphohydrolase 5 [Rhynchospora pubera]
MAKAGVTRTSLLVLLVVLFVKFCASDTGILNRKAAAGGRAVSEDGRYVIVFHAGGVFTMVHVFRFDENANLLKINGSLEVFHQAQKTISSYAEDPAAILSFVAPLLEKAIYAVPTNLQPETPVIFGAYDELYLLGEEKYEKILDVVRGLFSESPLLYKAEWVNILPAATQGAYLWESINYLMGNVGGDYSKTVAVLNQESASVQMAYAVSAKAAANAPKFPGGEEYITAHHIQSNNYYLYSHGYFPFGAYSVRTAILKYTNDSYTYCVTNGYNVQYNYYGEMYNVRAAPSGSSYEKCRANVLQALHLDATCYVENCTFDGAWNGGGGAGLEKIYLTNGFQNTGADVGITTHSKPSTDLRLLEYEKFAKVACGASTFEDAHNLFPSVPLFDLPYLCMDLVYVYTVLVDGFGIDPTKLVTAADSVPYGDSSMRIQWALGLALELISSNHTKMQDITNVFAPSRTFVQIV